MNEDANFFSLILTSEVGTVVSLSSTHSIIVEIHATASTTAAAAAIATIVVKDRRATAFRR
jgi:hypothetical protein